MSLKLKTLEEFTNKFVHNKELVTQLTKIPQTIKNNEKAKFIVPEKNKIIMADIIYMPDDTNNKKRDKDIAFKYILVVLDLATNNIDATELKYRDSEVVLLAFKRILSKSKYLTGKYSYIQLITDGGSEFKGVFSDFLKSKSIIHKTTVRGRHQQLQPIDSRIALISKYLNIAMLSNELITKTVNREWIKKMNHLIYILNQKKYLKKVLNVEDIDDFGQIITNYDKKKTNHEDIIPIGTKVRIKLDSAVNNITDKKYSIEKFRKGDLRYSKDIYKIETHVINPMQPVMNKVNNINNIHFLKKQLIIV